MPKLTNSAKKAATIENKLFATKCGEVCTLTYEEAQELACYMRQRTELLTCLAEITGMAARAILYIASIWEGRGSGEIYPQVVFFDKKKERCTFYYDKLLRWICQSQSLTKRIDPKLEFGFVSQGEED
jgi:hypothetical protein